MADSEFVQGLQDFKWYNFISHLYKLYNGTHLSVRNVSSRRIAVERAIREARERAFAEVKERAERAVVERAASEVQQRMAEAREKVEKTTTKKAFNNGYYPLLN